jgi:hypothetical protein
VDNICFYSKNVSRRSPAQRQVQAGAQNPKFLSFILEPGCCLPPACSCPAHRRTPPLLAHCLAVRPLPTANAIGVKPKLPEKCHNYLVDDFGPAR